MHPACRNTPAFVTWSYLASLVKERAKCRFTGDRVVFLSGIRQVPPCPPPLSTFQRWENFLFFFLFFFWIDYECVIVYRLKTVDDSQTHSPRNKTKLMCAKACGAEETEGGGGRVLHITVCQTTGLLSCAHMPAEERWRPNMWWRCSQWWWVPGKAGGSNRTEPFTHTALNMMTNHSAWGRLKQRLPSFSSTWSDDGRTALWPLISLSLFSLCRHKTNAVDQSRLIWHS